MLSGGRLGAVIASLPTRPRRGTFFRATPFIHAGDPLGKLRPINRQRFNVAGGARVLYLGDDPFTCLYEAQALGFPASSTTIVPVQFALNAVVDLTNPAVLRMLRTTRVALQFNFRSLPLGAPPADSQVLGEACAASGRIDGLFYESPARPGAFDLAVIERTLASLGSALIVNDPSNALHDALP